MDPSDRRSWEDTSPITIEDEARASERLDNYADDRMTDEIFFQLADNIALHSPAQAAAMVKERRAEHRVCQKRIDRSVFVKKAKAKAELRELRLKAEQRQRDAAEEKTVYEGAGKQLEYQPTRRKDRRRAWFSETQEKRAMGYWNEEVEDERAFIQGRKPLDPSWTLQEKRTPSPPSQITIARDPNSKAQAEASIPQSKKKVIIRTYSLRSDLDIHTAGQTTTKLNDVHKYQAAREKDREERTPLTNETPHPIDRPFHQRTPSPESPSPDVPTRLLFRTYSHVTGTLEAKIAAQRRKERKRATTTWLDDVAREDASKPFQLSKEHEEKREIAERHWEDEVEGERAFVMGTRRESNEPEHINRRRRQASFGELG